MAIRYTYSSNGQGIYGIDMETGKEGEKPRFPRPDDLWNMTFAKANAWPDRFAAMPFEDKGGSHPSRYYQDIAVERAMNVLPVLVARVRRMRGRLCPMASITRVSESQNRCASRLV